jgi:putative transposase
VNDGDNFREVGRKNPSPGVHVYLDRPTIAFLTVHTWHREPWLANKVAHSALLESWREATAWIVGEYILMPDHLHLFCAPQSLDFTIEQWIKYWKSLFRKKHGQAEWNWQSLGWHHRLREDEDYAAKWAYVRANPIRKGLVARTEDWPYWGRLHVLPWTGPIQPT